EGRALVGRDRLGVLGRTGPVVRLGRGVDGVRFARGAEQPERGERAGALAPDLAPHLRDVAPCRTISRFSSISPPTGATNATCPARSGGRSGNARMAAVWATSAEAPP